MSATPLFATPKNLSSSAIANAADLATFVLPPALVDRYSDAEAAYRDLHVAMSPVSAMLAVCEGKPTVAYFLYAIDGTHAALICKTEGEPDSLLVTTADDGSVAAMLDSVQEHVARLDAEGYTGLASSDEAVLLLPPSAEISLWVEVCERTGKDLVPDTMPPEDAGDEVMTALGEVIRAELGDDELREELGLTAAFAAARGDAEVDSDLELLNYVPDVQLLAWAHLLVRAGRGTAVGAALYLGEVSRAIANGDAPDVVARALLSRIPQEEQDALEGAMCQQLLQFRADDGEADLSPLRCSLEVAVEVGLVTWAPELFAWLTSKRGLSAWLRPDYSLLDCYPQNDSDSDDATA